MSNQTTPESAGRKSADTTANYITAVFCAALLKIPSSILVEYNVDADELANKINAFVASQQLTQSNIERDGWIDVKERLPEDAHDVIIGDEESDYVTVGFYDKNQDYWVTHDAPINVTHWRPLPQPPTSIDKK